MPRPRSSSNNFGGGLNDTTGHLAQFTRTLQSANREAGAGWRLQQRENREREGLITSLAKYRARSALLTGVIGGAGAIGAGISDAAKFGGDQAGGMIRSDSVRFATMNLLADHFDFGGIFSQVQTPIKRTAERVGDITTAIARAGGKVSPELRSSMRDIFLEQEKRAESERREVEKLMTGSETTGLAMQDTKLGEAVDKLSVILAMFEQAVRAYVEGGR